MEQVKDIEHLNKLLNDGHTDFVIANGLLRSSKYITKSSPETYFIIHLIDGTEEDITTDELLESNIGKAINIGLFFCE